MKLKIDGIYAKLKYLGVVTNKVPISYVGFKNRTTIQRSKTTVVVYLGIPKINLFAFYLELGNDADVLKTAYDMFVNLGKGDITEYREGLISWGNTGYPLRIGDQLRAIRK